MKSLKHIALVAMAVAVSAVPALAGTKYAANLVSNSPTDPVLPPTLSPKSSVKLDDKGAIAVSLAGVVEPGPSSCVGGTNDTASCSVASECPGGSCVASTVPVTTSTAYNDTFVLDGTEYVVIIKMVIPGISGLFDRVELPIPMDLKAGKGKMKRSAAALFAFIPSGIGRSLEIIGTEVWGPLGANAAACQAVISQSIPVSLVPVGDPDPTACRGGTQFGMSGLAIPPPPAP